MIDEIFRSLFVQLSCRTRCCLHLRPRIKRLFTILPASFFYILYFYMFRDLSVSFGLQFIPIIFNKWKILREELATKINSIRYVFEINVTWSVISHYSLCAAWIYDSHRFYCCLVKTSEDATTYSNLSKFWNAKICIIFWVCSGRNQKYLRNWEERKQNIERVSMFDNWKEFWFSTQNMYFECFGITESCCRLRCTLKLYRRFRQLENQHMAKY